jgi:4-alpha-glucanotransferase
MIRDRSFDPMVIDALNLLEINIAAMTSADADLLLKRQQELESMIEQLQALQDVQGIDSSSVPVQEELALRKAQRMMSHAMRSCWM